MAASMGYLYIMSFTRTRPKMDHHQAWIDKFARCIYDSCRLYTCGHYSGVDYYHYTEREDYTLTVVREHYKILYIRIKGERAICRDRLLSRWPAPSYLAHRSYRGSETSECVWCMPRGHPMPYDSYNATHFCAECQQKDTGRYAAIMFLLSGAIGQDVARVIMGIMVCL
jgi:hypothetical protein